MHTQFWDTSALVSLFYQEPYTPRALAARAVAERYLAWDWLILESWAALVRRGCSKRQRQARRRLLRQFGFEVLGEQHHPALRRLIERHRLRSADAGHLLCMQHTRRLYPGTVFVCCDRELIAAARVEKIKVWE